MSKAIITAERLVQLSQFNPRLQNVWYLLASSALSALNQPQEIPKLYHYTLMLHYNSTLPVKQRASPIELANKTIDLLSNCDCHSHHTTHHKPHNLIDKLYPIYLGERHLTWILTGKSLYVSESPYSRYVHLWGYHAVSTAYTTYTQRPQLPS